MTEPAATVALDAFVTVPTASPAVVIDAAAFAWDMPTTDGTATWLPSSPYTTSLLEKVATYTRPLAIVGGLNFEKLPNLSRAVFCSLFHNSVATLLASNARTIPVRN